jgi:hypothetical protein
LLRALVVVLIVVVTSSVSHCCFVGVATDCLLLACFLMVIGGGEKKNEKSPLFANVTVSLGGLNESPNATSATTLQVLALNQSPLNVYVQGVTLNGQAIGLGASAAVGAGGGVAVAYSDLMQGGELVFTMGPQPPDVVGHGDL